MSVRALPGRQGTPTIASLDLTRSSTVQRAIVLIKRPSRKRRKVPRKFQIRVRRASFSLFSPAVWPSSPPSSCLCTTSSASSHDQVGPVGLFCLNSCAFGGRRRADEWAKWTPASSISPLSILESWLSEGPVVLRPVEVDVRLRSLLPSVGTQRRWLGCQHEDSG